MTARLSHALPVTLMLLLGGLTLWLRHAMEGPGFIVPAQRNHDADATVEKFTVTRLNAAGAPELRLSAQKMVHFGDDDSTELQSPLLVKNDTDAVLSVRADRGVVTSDYDQAYFYDNVQLSRTEQGTVEPLLLRTGYLHVLVRQDFISTDRPVTISQGASSISGTGMEYDRKTGRLSLLSTVKATYDAKRR
jgi:lipopolysaccharide export system protein LptC